jgi:hypothetical protein
MKQFAYPVCKRCSRPTTKAGNYTNMALSGILDPMKFDQRYGMMCGDHASELSRQIMRERKLTKEDWVEANMRALEIMAGELPNRGNLKQGPFAMIELIKGEISFDEEDNANIFIERLHEWVQDLEYANLVLYYYAKVLFNLDPDQAVSVAAYEFLFNATEAIADANLDISSDILHIADIDDVIKMVSSPVNKKHCYAATLHMILDNPAERHIVTSLPAHFYVQHMTFTVPILVQGVLDKVGKDKMHIMQKALKDMNRQYKQGANYRELKYLHAVPMRALLMAYAETLL